MQAWMVASAEASIAPFQRWTRGTHSCALRRRSARAKVAPRSPHHHGEELSPSTSRFGALLWGLSLLWMGHADSQPFVGSRPVVAAGSPNTDASVAACRARSMHGCAQRGWICRRRLHRQARSGPCSCWAHRGLGGLASANANREANQSLPPNWLHLCTECATPRQSTPFGGSVCPVIALCMLVGRGHQ